MKDQWLKGLQWGAVAWLGWEAFVTVNTAVRYIAQYHARATYQIACGIYAVSAIVALAALVLAWTRWSRIGIAALILAQVAMALIFFNGYPRPPVVIEGVVCDTEMPWMAIFHANRDVFPLLPLLFLPPERPRLTMALALVGRWRDALPHLAGWRWIAVAAAVLCLSAAVGDAATAYEDDNGIIAFLPWQFLAALAPCALLLGLAAVPPWRARRESTA
jgi:hypothetical protein